MRRIFTLLLQRKPRKTEPASRIPRLSALRVAGSFALLCWGFALAQPPSGIAIRNARIVTGSGPVINKGTVVLRNGLIDAVGENVTIPGDAWIIDGEGLTVYPGLIDSISTIAVADPAAAAASTATGGRGVGAAPSTASPARGPEDRPLTTSWLRAADQIATGDRRVESARNAGFTTAVVWPKRGIFAGQGAVINLGGEKATDMIIAPSAGQYMTLSNGGFGAGYPASLMGSISYIRQVFIDADRYTKVKKQYADNPRGMTRPEYDRALEGVIDSPRLLLPANRAVEITRMIAFAKELKRPTVLYGLQEGYRAADAVKASGLPVLLNLRWPEKTPNGDPEELDSLKALEMRDRAPSTPAEFAKKGILFAFYGDTEQPRDTIKAVRKAMTNGLSEADALKALTINAAEIFGVADRLGSIEKGKIANVVVTKGGIFDERQQVMHVIVDGVKYEPTPDAAAPGTSTTMNARPRAN
jgi:imidazolonepropionase-like amidohydrolase